MTRISYSIASRCAIATALLALVAACGHQPDPAVTRGAPYDPYEQSNRINHERNKKLDRAVLRPVSTGYSAVMPDVAETGISNFATNLSLPGAMVNSALQGNGVGLTSDFYRFLVNTTVGLGGLIDVATELNMPARTDADFGQTLYTWGVHEGPYVQLPLIGPSTSRAVGGRVVDIFTNPLGYWIQDPESYYAVGTRVSKGMTARTRYSGAIDSVLYESADSYAATRSLYLQNRRFKLSGGGTGDMLDPYDTTGGAPAGTAVSADFEDPYDQ
ncbi:MlaA family lipoprotein [Roseovarius nanhaiticus]|uniref:MlaA family lipoprotein n=1 Tax=Roseovarius nanhaiticus TaxID=573024 RepID=UPI001FCCEAFC|nr:VacJ family lipoprotein [Roseovarius nanhaiticus]